MIIAKLLFNFPFLAAVKTLNKTVKIMQEMNIFSSKIIFQVIHNLNKIHTAMLLYSRFIWITNSSDQKRVCDSYI